jgi:hypothetical protein
MLSLAGLPGSRVHGLFYLPRPANSVATICHTVFHEQVIRREERRWVETDSCLSCLAFIACILGDEGTCSPPPLVTSGLPFCEVRGGGVATDVGTLFNRLWLNCCGLGP